MRYTDQINFLITMYNEFETVQQTVSNIRNTFDNAKVFVVQSHDGSGRVIADVDYFITLENLGTSIKHHKLASHAITRNYGKLFSKMYERGPACSSVAAITGDTLLSDPSMVVRVQTEMLARKKTLACSQAIGQNFHAPDSDPEHGICGGRMQFEGISDFMPQFFMVDGEFAFQTSVFSQIAVTNEFTSEQCLGDEFMSRVAGSFYDHALIIAKNAYEYADGIAYQVRTCL